MAFEQTNIQDKDAVLTDAPTPDFNRAVNLGGNVAIPSKSNSRARENAAWVTDEASDNRREEHDHEKAEKQQHRQQKRNAHRSGRISSHQSELYAYMRDKEAMDILEGNNFEAVTKETIAGEKSTEASKLEQSEKSSAEEKKSLLEKDAGDKQTEEFEAATKRETETEKEQDIDGQEQSEPERFQAETRDDKSSTEKKSQNPENSNETNVDNPTQSADVSVPPGIPKDMAAAWKQANSAVGKDNLAKLSSMEVKDQIPTQNVALNTPIQDKAIEQQLRQSTQQSRGDSVRMA